MNSLVFQSQNSRKALPRYEAKMARLWLSSRIQTMKGFQHIMKFCTHTNMQTLFTFINYVDFYIKKIVQHVMIKCLHVFLIPIKVSFGLVPS